MAYKSVMMHYLERDFSEPFRDPVWGDIALSLPFKALTGSSAFQHLAGIRQLGPAYLVYPGAVHTRLAHSLGVFHMARRLLLLLTRSNDQLFLEKEEMNIFLAAALFHDLGHFPFAHSLKELPLADHEALTGEIVSEGELSRMIPEQLGISGEDVALVVDENLPLPENRKGKLITFFRSLLSGVLDPDKLDYLNRDAFFCGVPYGYQDVDNILARTCYIPSLEGDNFGRIGVDQVGTMAVENLLFSKYLMYRSVYWHRTVRIATAMIKQAVLLALTEGKIKPEMLYYVDDATFFRRTSDSDYPPFSLVDRVIHRRLFKTVFEGSVDDTTHLPSDPQERLEASIKAAGRLSTKLGLPVRPEEIIADIPEPISFETALPVWRGEDQASLPFPESGTVFSSELVKGFSHTLRKVRIFLPPGLAEKSCEAGLCSRDMLELFL